MSLREKLSYYRQELRVLGLSHWLHFKVQALRARWSRKGKVLSLRVPMQRQPLFFRAGTTDLKVFHQIIIANEYRCLDDAQDVRFVIDCGANVGYSSAWFLAKHPGSFLIAIEPDNGNFEMLQRNLQPYRHRCRLVASGVWSRQAGLVISEQQMGAGGEWAVMVREARPGEAATMQAVDIGTLLQTSNHERISILKMDIEGAEEIVFAQPPAWIDRVDNLVIELHTPRCAEVFEKAVASQDFERSRCDELHVLKRRSKQKSAEYKRRESVYF